MSIMIMIYGSVCSGIEAATVAWYSLGWRPSFFSEIDPFPRAVLSYHYPAVPLHGDFTTIRKNYYAAIDLLVGGTPCQSFSVAGLRKGLDDQRGLLAIEYLGLADRLGPRWLVWENVPGVLSANRGRDFGSFLGGLVELGYGFAYRVLDAQYFGVPQRRRRVFVVGYLGDWRPAAAVLFERQSMRGYPPPSRRAGEGSTAPIARSIALRGREGGGTAELGDECGLTLRASSGGGDKPYVMIAHRPIPVPANDNLPIPLLEIGKRAGPAANDKRAGMGIGRAGDPMFTLQAGAQHGVAQDIRVRRLTPRECERLQGFPDDYTLIPWRGKPADQCPDGPRYKSLGNSMCVLVMRWIGRRIQMADALVPRPANANTRQPANDN